MIRFQRLGLICATAAMVICMAASLAEDVRDKYGAIAQCGPSHSQSACCRIVSEVDGKRYIECG